jgi:DNA-binding beta-propeller fold protein YncE
MHKKTSLNLNTMHKLALFFLLVISSSQVLAQTKRYLYVAEPGVRNYLEYGGHGVLVYDIDDNYKLVKRIITGSYDNNQHPSNVKGVCVSLATQSIYIATIKSLMRISLTTDQLLWEQVYPKGCDRMAISPDGLTIYQSSFEKDSWYIIDANTGAIKKEVFMNKKAHNTLAHPNGKEIYMESLNDPIVTVVNKTGKTLRAIGPFSAPVRPFTVDFKRNLFFANVNNLLGFGIADLKTGKVIKEITVPGFAKGYIKRHGCPSHGIGLRPDGAELWIADGANQRMHIFDTVLPEPSYKTSVTLRDQPGWITFSLDGRHAWPSTGEIIDATTKQIIKTLSDEHGGIVQSEKLVEIHFSGNKAVAKGDQFAFTQ